MKKESRLSIPIAMAVALTLAGCASVDPVCRAGLAPMTEAVLFFGRNIHSGSIVSDKEWQQFVDQEVAPRFPSGFSVDDSTGQWRGDDGVVVREPSKRLTIVLPDAAADQSALQAIRAAYKRRFRQDSVLLVEHPVCGSF